ncbi:MAG: glucose-6-phosphate isomerase family protein [Patescibacteria group bacterium]
MNLASVRNYQELKSVLKEGIKGPDPCYWVFNQIGHEKWENLTVVAPGVHGTEFNKTFGHYHPLAVNETYRLVSGRGLLLLQKKIENNEKVIENEISEFLVIKAEEGDEIVITPEYGHSWINLGTTPLLSLDNWKSGHSLWDYQIIQKMGGLAYYVLKDGTAYKLEKNPKYFSPPSPIFLTSKELMAK